MAYGLTSLFAMTTYLFYLLYSYCKLMVAKYGCKREKSREAKWRSAKEQKPVWEMERAVDVDLFLEAQEPWAKDSPHWLIILHEMFLHAAYEGQRRQNELSAGAASSICLNWTLRWVYLPSSWYTWRLTGNNC